MPPQQRDPANERNRNLQLYAVASLLVALFGVVVLALGFVVFSPSVSLGLGLGGAAVALGALHLRRALSATDDGRSQSRSAATAPGEDESAPGREPIAVLKGCYARGDVDDAEFERRLARLLEVDSDDGEGSRIGRRDEERARER